jgi:hypothetical protein
VSEPSEFRRRHDIEQADPPSLNHAKPYRRRPATGPNGRETMCWHDVRKNTVEKVLFRSLHGRHLGSKMEPSVGEFLLDSKIGIRNLSHPTQLSNHNYRVPLNVISEVGKVRLKRIGSGISSKFEHRRRTKPGICFLAKPDFEIKR